MASESFELVFQGDPVKDGSMDIKQLAPSLLALGEVCERANYVLNGPDVEASLKMRATGGGSVEILLEFWQLGVDAITTLPGVRELMTPDQILTLLGFSPAIADWKGVQSLLELLRSLKGLVPRKVEESDSTVTLETNYGTIVVNKNTYNFYADDQIVNGIAEMIEPVRREGMSGLEVRRQGKLVERVVREEVNLMKLPEGGPEEVISETTGEYVAEIVTPHFRPGEYKWRFSEGQGRRFTANMRASEFIEDIKEGRQGFKIGDFLRFKMTTRSVMTPRGLKTEREVVAVDEVIPSPYQQRLLGGQDGES